MNIAATRSLIDDDQGLCPEGHPCHLIERSDLDCDRFLRECHEPHPETEGEPYQGMPLVRWEATRDEIEAAATAGADPVFIDEARSWADDQGR